MKIKILHLYPDLLNLYGDRGNIECMRKRLMWRGIDAEVVTYTCEDSGFDLSDVDIVHRRRLGQRTENCLPQTFGTQGRNKKLC